MKVLKIISLSELFLICITANLANAIFTQQTVSININLLSADVSITLISKICFTNMAKGA